MSNKPRVGEWFRIVSGKNVGAVGKLSDYDLMRDAALLSECIGAAWQNLMVDGCDLEQWQPREGELVTVHCCSDPRPFKVERIDPGGTYDVYGYGIGFCGIGLENLSPTASPQPSADRCEAPKWNKHECAVCGEPAAFGRACYFASVYAALKDIADAPLCRDCGDEVDRQGPNHYQAVADRIRSRRSLHAPAGVEGPGPSAEWFETARGVLKQHSEIEAILFSAHRPHWIYPVIAGQTMAPSTYRLHTVRCEGHEAPENPRRFPRAELLATLAKAEAKAAPSTDPGSLEAKFPASHATRCRHCTDPLDSTAVGGLHLDCRDLLDRRARALLDEAAREKRASGPDPYAEHRAKGEIHSVWIKTAWPKEPDPDWIRAALRNRRATVDGGKGETHPASFPEGAWQDSTECEP